MQSIDWTKITPTALALLSALITVLSPQIQSFLAAHPTLTSVVASVGVILAHFSQSPVPPKEE